MAPPPRADTVPAAPPPQQQQQQQPPAAVTAEQAGRIRSMAEFYPFYQQQHSKTGTRVAHVLGTGLALAHVVAAAASGRPRLLLQGIVAAYGCAWLGHAFVEHNKPATFKYPLWSLLSDIRMFFAILTGREKLTGA